jgi:hypothetical protein
LNDSQKTLAKNLIVAIYDNLTSRSNNVDQNFEEIEDQTDELESILREKEQKRTGKSLTLQTRCAKNALSCFDGIPRQKDENFNIFEYWARIGKDFQDLRETSNVIFAGAGTQVSNEREKSTLKFYLNDKENRELDTPMLEAILFIIANQKYSK